MILLKKEKIKCKIQCFRFQSPLIVKNKFKIVQKEIKQYEKEKNFGYLECPHCKSDKLIGHGSYQRNVIINNHDLKIKIKRVRCKNCGRTHALIPYFLVTYFQHEKTLIYRVCIELILKHLGICELANQVEVSRQILYQWKKRFLRHVAYLLTTFPNQRTLKSTLKYLLNESLSEDLYEQRNQMYFLKRIPT